MGLDSPGFDAEIDTFENVYAWSILKGVSRHFASLALDVTHDSLLFLCYFNSCHFVFSTPSQDTAQSALQESMGPMQSLPEWAFRARPGLWRICLCPKVARIAEHKFGSR